MISKSTAILLLGGTVVHAQTPPATNPPAPRGMMPYVAILDPQLAPASQANFLQDDSIVIGVAYGSVAKAYPAADLAQHGSVNDQMPDGPIEVTWCGTCMTGAVFRARIQNRLLHFDYDSMVGANEVHKDRETGSRWQQSTGEAISGPLKGRHLDLYPFVRTTWKEWRRRYPNTIVLKPLPGYDERMPNLDRLMKRETSSSEGEAPKSAFGHDNRLRPKEIVAGMHIAEGEKAYPFSQLRISRVINDNVGGLPVLVVHQPSSDTTTAFEARAKGRVLRFDAEDDDAGSLMDRETHSSWDAYGLCLKGPLKGIRLKTVVLVPEFWFAWSEFHTNTEVYSAGGSQKSPTLPPGSKLLLQEPLGDTTEPRMSLFILTVVPGMTVPTHSHSGSVFAYLLEGEIENQVEPDPPQIYEPGGFFHERPMQVHRLLRNLSKTDPAKILIFQNTDSLPATGNPLRQEALPDLTNQVVTMLTLGASPGMSASTPHKHPGPVFGYVLKGEIETQVDPDPPKTYRAGDVFYEPPMHTHRLYRNLSQTERAEVLIFEVTPKDQPLGMPAELKMRFN